MISACLPDALLLRKFWVRAGRDFNKIDGLGLQVLGVSSEMVVVRCG
jgi:hypothetical protein